MAYSMNYYERHIGDYLKDTSHLSLLEHGVYTRLMDVYYTKETGIPKEDAARLGSPAFAGAPAAGDAARHGIHVFAGAPTAEDAALLGSPLPLAPQ